MIKELLDNQAKVTLFTRPRRLGKTLNMSMLKYYFEDDWDWQGNRRDWSGLFEPVRRSRELLFNFAPSVFSCTSSNFFPWWTLRFGCVVQ